MEGAEEGGGVRAQGARVGTHVPNVQAGRSPYVTLSGAWTAAHPEHEQTGEVLLESVAEPRVIHLKVRLQAREGRVTRGEPPLVEVARVRGLVALRVRDRLGRGSGAVHRCGLRACGPCLARRICRDGR